MKTRLTLKPGQKGTKQLTDKYGAIVGGPLEKHIYVDNKDKLKRQKKHLHVDDRQVSTYR